MASEKPGRIAWWSAWFPPAAGWGVAIVGGLAVIGWLLPLAPLRAEVPGFTPIQPVMAVTFLLYGLALALCANPPCSSARRIAALVCSALAAGWGGLVLLDFILAMSGSGIGPALAGLTLWTQTPFDIPTSTWSLLPIVLLGVAPCFLNSRRHHWFGEFLILAPLCITFLGLVGEAFRVINTTPAAVVRSSALPTVLPYLLLETGLLLARPYRGWMGLLTGPGLGGALARRLLPFAILVPFVAAWVRQIAEQADILTRELGGTLYALGIVLVQAIVVMWYAVTVNRNDRKRKEAEEALRQSEASLREDVVARKQVEEALRQADRRKDEFLATLAHELRNPLAPIRNSLALLRLVGADGPESGKAIDIMERQMEQMVRIVDDLLDMSRITRNKIELRLERIRVSSVIQSAVETSRPQIEAGHHELSVSQTPEPLWLNADLTRLTQVVSNLLNNAAKYTPSGGRIWLSVERQRDDVLIRVRDSGVGIPAEMLPHIFEMFTQVDSTRARAGGGLGIGLTLVKKLVELHHGSVRADSAGAGQGSQFIVRLPLCSAKTAKPATGHGVQIQNGHPARRVLVVDDNQDSANSLSVLLKLMGNEVRTAYDARAALNEVTAFRPEVALLDIGMPGMNGYELARELRARPDLDGLVLVAVTGFGQEEDRWQSQKAGFDHHLTKPADHATLNKLITALSV